MHLYVPSLMLLTSASVRIPDGAVTKALTLPSPVGVTDLASTVNSAVEPRNTPVNGNHNNDYSNHFDTSFIHILKV